VRLGAFGSLSTVAEDAAYTTLTLADTSASYTPAKRGNLVQVTRETIINDDLYAIKQIPQKLAVAAAFTLAEFVYNLIAPGGGNIYDAHPLFDSINHLNTGVLAANLGTANSGAALSSAALQTAIIKMRKQQNMAAKPIGLKPRYLLVPPDLEFSAMTILRSAGLPGGNNNDINPTLKVVRGGSPMFVLAGESGESAALVRGCSPVFAPTVAKTVAISGLSAGGHFVLCPICVALLHMDAIQEIMETPGQRHKARTRFTHIAAEVGKELAEALRDIVVMVAGEAAKRAIWG